MEASASMDIVSVIVPSWNKEDFVGEAIDSALCQTGVEVEVVVVDDGSTDRSVEILEGYGDRIRLHRPGKNSGAARARNTGASLATGNFFMFLDADDVLRDPGTLAAMVEALDGGIDRFAACPWQRLRLENDRWEVYSPKKPLDPPGGDPVLAWLGNWYIPPCAVLWPRELFENSGGWNPALGATDDQEIMIRMLLRGARIATASRGEALYRFFEEGGTLSTTPSRRLVAGRLAGDRQIEAEMIAQGLLPRYAHALGQKYSRLARTHLSAYPDLALEALGDADRLLDRSRVQGSPIHRVLARALGLQRKERITRWMARRGLVNRSSTTGRA